MAEPVTEPSVQPHPSYRWGRLLARSAAVGGLFCLAAGVAAAVVQILLLRAALAGLVLRPAPGYGDEVASLRAACAGAAAAVAAAVPGVAVPPVPSAAFPDAIRDRRDLAAARSALAAHQGYVEGLQASLLASFGASTDWLLESLRSKAEKIRRGLEASREPEAMALEARIEGLRRQLESRDDGLYSAMDQSERQRRLDTLDQAGGFLEVLGSLGGGPAVQARIDAAAAALAGLRQVIPAPSPEGRRLRLVQELAELRRAQSDLVKAGHQLRGEELASHLEAVCRDVAGAVQTSWAAGDCLERLRGRLDLDDAAIEALSRQRAEVRGRGLAKAVVLLLSGAAAALLLRVVADVLTALFDAAEALKHLARRA